MRVLFTALTGAGMFVAVLIPTAPTSVPLALAAALLTAGSAFLVWPWIVGRSGIDDLIANTFDDDWRDDGSGERAGWDGTDLRGLSPHNAWLTAPDKRGFTADSSATAEIPTVASTVERTVVYSTGLFDLRLRRPRGKRRAGAR